MEERKEAGFWETCVLMASLFLESALVNGYLHIPLLSFAVASKNRLPSITTQLSLFHRYSEHGVCNVDLCHQ